MAAQASARKVKGVYKPLIKFPNGKTQVVEQNPERFDTYTKRGVIAGNKYAQGNTYETRAEAINAAHQEIQNRLESAKKHYEKTPHPHNAKNVELYGGTV